MCTVISSLQRLGDHAPLVSVQCMNQLHNDWVRKVSYVWHNHSFISCANSPLSSLVMKDIGRKKKSYVFRIRKVCERLICLLYECIGVPEVWD